MQPLILAPEGAQRVAVRVWARAPGAAALRQLRVLASQPYVSAHVAAMPDVHVAEGVAVGSVFVTTDALVPGALGGDLGCGMSALRFPVPAAALDRAQLARILADLARVVPVGDAAHPAPGVALPAHIRDPPLSTRALARTRDVLGPRHLGTLGGGNHFLELDRDAAGDLWVLAHTGSRGVGAAVAAHHVAAARAAGHGGDGALASLRADSPAGLAYQLDAALALAFARANRDALARAADVLAEHTHCAPDAASVIDVHHNFAALERHDGRDLWVHRKGATPAASEQPGIVPGSMGTASYIVHGLGNADSYASCSHGAGRVLSRREARAQIRPAALVHAMRRVVFAEARAPALVEEAPAAYRDIVEVLEDQRDLVRPVLRLVPIAVLKG